ncbi:recombination factor protein RarA [Reticulomyxa filosa]|uniref:Recombination factor protein RarA n=1 Tax=Reticulomyxa filosa TaxID=46433 RepID=X6MTL0_RETFI|nr:recombination factor protein RarA [Reticulomyxa filosa]|eukprot:ETO17308.1 recombination factor protein RarA [Reticulomyxa filosa]
MPLLSLGSKPVHIPLADRLRPTEFNAVYGQEHLIFNGSMIENMINSGHISSLILWGPPGCGKTTIARILAEKVGYHFQSISAVTSGTSEIRNIFSKAEERKRLGFGTVLLIDEIHHFNRTQQDIFLPHIENGTIVLVGATTENPSFELNSALLSRCKVLILNRLDHFALQKIADRAEQLCSKSLPLTEEAKSLLFDLADGDGRYLLNMCEILFDLNTTNTLSSPELLAIIQKKRPLYDKSRDGHYNLISALHKSLRGSDCDASLYWLSRMLEGGDNPLYIIRRLVRCAIEDIGLADPNALTQALAAKEAYELLGSPEGELGIAQATIYLATAPKSNAVYTAFKNANSDAKRYSSLMPPKHILNAPTKMMKDHGYSDGYTYDHNTKEGFSGQSYFPESMERNKYYKPIERGFEREIQSRLLYWEQLRQKAKSSK